MMNFFDNTVLLQSETATKLYDHVKDLPIIDYHCHLDPYMISEDAHFSDIGEFWLKSDHYKWRAMRLCGVEEKYITGDADFREKFLKYAEIMPMLCGNPLYYWTHMELSQIFGITKPLNKESGEEIYKEATEKLKSITVSHLLKKFKVEYIATTDDPTDDLKPHGKYGNTVVAPTFRPDKVFSFEKGYLEKLSLISGYETSTLKGLMNAISARMDYFVSHGCTIADIGFGQFPLLSADFKEAEKIYENKENMSGSDQDKLVWFLLSFILKECKKRDMTVQLHFGVVRNVNPEYFKKCGSDSGFDVIGVNKNVDPTQLLAKIPESERPSLVLYSLNDSPLPALACITGAFRNVRMGAAWWFNDTVLGIRKNLQTIAEYSVLGTCTGMLTDSRSFSSYVRFDFFRRILASVVAEYVERGEYDLSSAYSLVENICYKTPKYLIKQK